MARMFQDIFLTFVYSEKSGNRIKGGAIGRAAIPSVSSEMVYTFLVGGEYGQTQKLTGNKTGHAQYRGKTGVDGTLAKSSKQKLTAISGTTHGPTFFEVMAGRVEKWLAVPQTGAQTHRDRAARLT